MIQTKIFEDDDNTYNIFSNEMIHIEDETNSNNVIDINDLNFEMTENYQIMLINNLKCSRDQTYMRKDNIFHILSLDLDFLSPITKTLIDKNMINLENFKKWDLSIGSIVTTRIDDGRQVISACKKNYC